MAAGQDAAVDRRDDGCDEREAAGQPPVTCGLDHHGPSVGLSGQQDLVRVDAMIGHEHIEEASQDCDIIDPGRRVPGGVGRPPEPSTVDRGSLGVGHCHIAVRHEAGPAGQLLDPFGRTAEPVQHDHRRRTCRPRCRRCGTPQQGPPSVAEVDALRICATAVAAVGAADRRLRRGSAGVVRVGG